MDNSKDKKKSLSKESKLQEPGKDSRFIVDDKKEVVVQPSWNKDEENQSRIPLSLASLIIPDIKELRSFSVEEAEARIGNYIQQNEQIEWIDKFEFKTVQDSARDAVIFGSIIVIFALLAPTVGGYLGMDVESIQQMILRIVPIMAVVMMVFWGLTQLIGRKTFIALTNFRIIICGAGKESWIWTIYGEDILSIDMKDKLGKRVIQIIFTTNRPSFNYIGDLYLNNIKNADLVLDKLKTYKSTVKTASEDRLDKPEKITVAALKSKSKSGVYKFFSIEPGVEIMLGLVGLAFSTFLYFSNSSAVNWPSVQAIYQKSVITSDTGFSKKFYLQRIYTYDVGGTKYDFKDELKAAPDSETETGKVLNEKSVEPITIRYNPIRPVDSKYNPAKKLESALVLGLYSLAFCITGLFVKSALPEQGWKSLLIHYLILATTLVLAYQLGTYIKF